MAPTRSRRDFRTTSSGYLRQQIPDSLEERLLVDGLHGLLALRVRQLRARIRARGRRLEEALVHADGFQVFKAFVGGMDVLLAHPQDAHDVGFAQRDGLAVFVEDNRVVAPILVQPEPTSPRLLRSKSHIANSLHSMLA